MYSKAIHIILTGYFFYNTFSVNAAEFKQPIIHFSITPLACIVKQIGDECQLTTTVDWQSEQALDVCLIQDKVALKCWQNAISGKSVLPVQLNRTTTFTLKNNKTQILAKQLVKISATTPKKYRRKLRSDWSLF